MAEAKKPAALVVNRHLVGPGDTILIYTGTRWVPRLVHDLVWHVWRSQTKFCGPLVRRAEWRFHTGVGDPIRRTDARLPAGHKLPKKPK